MLACEQSGHHLPSLISLLSADCGQPETATQQHCRVWQENIGIAVVDGILQL